ncbi:hypothetical protein AVEN_173582-1 [Araneus ventricosus]|uniref:Uncharacterized protein n=1 Tax=Araneus ventricosus TaxID=182803 RepID=A0A4Y2CQU3_ARAVE|nr:hypothetical protein AVEN_173582-1 [Araneus ventricosus]
MWRNERHSGDRTPSIHPRFDCESSLRGALDRLLSPSLTSPGPQLAIFLIINSCAPGSLSAPGFNSLAKIIGRSDRIPEAPALPRDAPRGGDLHFIDARPGLI